MRQLGSFLFIFLLGISAVAQSTFRVPALSGPVVDEVGMMTRGDRRDLEATLQDWHKRGVAQVQVLVLASLQGLTIEDAAVRIFDQWRLGDLKNQNGVLFLVAADERRMRIEVGKGLEGALPDVIAKRILDDQVRPLFRAGRPSAGIMVGTYEILKSVDGEYSGPPPSEGGDVDVVAVIVFIVFLLMIFSRALRGGRVHRGISRGGLGGLGGIGGWGGSSGGSGGGGWSGGGGLSGGGGASSGW